MNIVGLITARGGSKGIPRKALAPCAGRPLLSYTCQAARESRLLPRTLLSTDDETIAALGREWQIEVPFLRPAHLATDTASSIAVIQHALAWLDEQGEAVDAICLLQPTSPLRTANHIDAAIESFTQHNAESLVSVYAVPHSAGPQDLMTLEDQHLSPCGQGGNRQDKPRYYARNGPAIVISRAHLIRQGQLYGEPNIGFVMDKRCAIDIDDADDLYLAEAVLHHARG